MPSSSNQFVIAASNRSRLEAASRWIEALPQYSEVLFLAPHRGAADDFARQVCRRRGGLWGVHRLTPAQLASYFATHSLAAGPAVSDGSTGPLYVMRWVGDNGTDHPSHDFWKLAPGDDGGGSEPGGGNGNGNGNGNGKGKNK